ncbi:hypothetical protein BH23CHL5_BH23CHL5_26330 [soil metagenome]
MSIPAPVLPADTDDQTPRYSRRHRHELEITANVLRSVFIVAALIAAGTAIGAGLYGVIHSNRIYEGISVAGVNVGGMTRSEASAALHDTVGGATDPPIILVSGSQKFSLDPGEAGIIIDVDRTVDAAFQWGRDGSFFARSGKWVDALISGKSTPILVSYDQDVLDSALMSIVPAITRPAEDARIAFDEDGTPGIIPEIPGYGFDLVTTRQAMIDRIASLSFDPVEIITPLVQPQVVVADLQAGLLQTQAALQAPLIVEGVDTNWVLTPTEIQLIVSVGGESQELVVDEMAIVTFVDSIAQDTNQEARSAELTVNSDGRLAAIPGQDGIEVLVDGTSRAIVTALQDGTDTVELQIVRDVPPILTEQAEAAATEGEELLQRGVRLTWDDNDVDLTRSQLLAALTFVVRPDEENPFVFGFDPDVLRDSLTSVFESAEVPAVEPQLRYVDRQIVILSEGENGKTVNVESTIDNVLSALATGEETARLVVETQEPSMSAPVIDELTFEDVLAEASTYYGDSSNARRLNVEVASELQSGWLVAPGQEFSFAQYIGSVDEPSGFVTGFGIVDDPSGEGVTTAPVIGGGICQVSTTIFQAAFWAGLEIVERYSHPYWIQAYGEPPRGMQGLDAMVNIEDSGSLDLRFTNTTGNWIVVDVEADGTTVTVKVRGTNPGWRVEVSQPVIYNEVQPTTQTRYTNSSELPTGQQLQVEYSQKGFTSEVTRVITDEDGEVIDTSYVVSTYSPSQNTILRGTGAPEATPPA